MYVKSEVLLSLACIDVQQVWVVDHYFKSLGFTKSGGVFTRLHCYTLGESAYPKRRCTIEPDLYLMHTCSAAQSTELWKRDYRAANGYES